MIPRASLIDFHSQGQGRSKQSLRLWLRLLGCANMVEQHVRQWLREHFDITLPQFDVLSELERADGPLTMSQLSRELMVSNGNITVVVDHLERAGLVARQPSTTDRRVQLIALTDDGRRRFAQMADAHAERIAALFAQLPDDIVHQLTEQLRMSKESVKTFIAKEQA